MNKGNGVTATALLALVWAAGLQGCATTAASHTQGNAAPAASAPSDPAAVSRGTVAAEQVDLPDASPQQQGGDNEHAWRSVFLQDYEREKRGLPVVLDRDPYEGKPPPDICYRAWLYPAIAFEPGSSELVPCAIRVLDESIKTLRQHPDLRVEVAGHTDSAGSDAGNKALSLRRAQVVYDYLTARGVPPSMLMAPVGYGSERLLYMDTSSDGSTIDREAARSNRRVELNVQNDAPQSAATGTAHVDREMVTVENLLRWPLEGKAGADKAIAGLLQVFKVREVQPSVLSGREPVLLDDGYILTFTSISTESRDIDIGVKQEPCLPAEQAAAAIGAVASPVVDDAHGIDRGKTYDARRNGMWVNFTTTPATYRCVDSIHVHPIQEAQG